MTDQPISDRQAAPSRPTWPSNKSFSHGYCRLCGRQHGLGQGDSYQPSLDLMASLERFRSIDLFSGRRAEADLATDVLFGPARGKMFGLMTCRGPGGDRIILRAFSGQYQGRWQIAGWVPPLFDPTELTAISGDTEARIKGIGREMADLPRNSASWRDLRRQRKGLSQELMKDIHRLYQLHNFCGETASLAAAYTGPAGIPTGTGDCCAPKLFNYAARHNLIPLGITEFYWGRPNLSATRRHGFLYPSCREKCQPILGFMLCGLTGEEASTDD